MRPTELWKFQPHHRTQVHEVGDVTTWHWPADRYRGAYVHVTDDKQTVVALSLVLAEPGEVRMAVRGDYESWFERWVVLMALRWDTRNTIIANGDDPSKFRIPTWFTLMSRALGFAFGQRGAMPSKAVSA